MRKKFLCKKNYYLTDFLYLKAFFSNIARLTPRMIGQLLFVLISAVGIYMFVRQLAKIRRNILLGKDISLNDHSDIRWKTMLRVAFGQSKMSTRPIPFILHFIVYAGFILINIEVIEIFIDGIFGTHRFLSFLGPVYDIAIGFFEILAFGVLVACAIFLLRRFVVRIKRFTSKDLDGFPRKDAAAILITEIVLMGALLKMNAADQLLQQADPEHFVKAGSFPISGNLLVPIFKHFSVSTLEYIEQICWWFHIIGILIFMNYLPYSKHFHVILAFPNTFYSNLNPKGKVSNVENITTEVKLMLDPSTPLPEAYAPPERFGVKDVFDLHWKNLMDAYTCTECGRCTSVCPQNQTGKALSPRRIMMQTRDRLEMVGKNIDTNGTYSDDGKSLHDFISPEELWACNACNACVEACPVNINPLEIILEMRRYQVMEQSAAPNSLNMMFSNLENNQAPWQFSPMDRANWITNS